VPPSPGPLPPSPLEVSELAVVLSLSLSDVLLVSIAAVLEVSSFDVLPLLPEVSDEVVVLSEDVVVVSEVVVVLSDDVVSRIQPASRSGLHWWVSGCRVVPLVVPLSPDDELVVESVVVVVPAGSTGSQPPFTDV